MRFSLGFAIAATLLATARVAIADEALLLELAKADEASHRYPEALDRLAALAAERTSPELEEHIADLRKRVAVIAIHTTVCDAEVRVRGAVVGKTCAAQTFKVNAGIARVEVAKAGHAPFAETIELPAEKTTTVAVPLKPLDQSILVVRSSVPGAHVAVDGEAAGTAPTEIIVRPGTHAVVVSQDGYETRNVKAIVGVGQRSDVDLHLEEQKTLADRWWFWTAVGVGLAAAVTTTVVLIGGGKSDSEGTIAPGRVSAPLRF